MSCVRNIIELREEQLDQTAHIITRSFLQLNDIWKSRQPQLDEVYPVLRWKILSSLRSGWSYVIGGRDVGAVG